MEFGLLDAYEDDEPVRETLFGEWTSALKVGDLRRLHAALHGPRWPSAVGLPTSVEVRAPDQPPSIGDCGLSVVAVLQSFARTIHAHPQPTPPTVESFEPWHQALDAAAKEILVLFRRFSVPSSDDKGDQDQPPASSGKALTGKAA